MPTHGEIFDFIYRNDTWQGGSGTGSREESTRDYREFLQQFMQAARITSVVDLGCGDWQFSRLIDWNGIDYTGVDASAVVLENTGKFARPGIHFLHADGMTDALPAADLLIVKDVLQHWSNADITAFLPQLQNYKGALITNGFPPDGESFVNCEIHTGAKYRPVDLRRPPFNLPGRYVFDFIAGEPKKVFLWRRATP
jgi:SAM-dependent methyltransferase